MRCCFVIRRGLFVFSTYWVNNSCHSSLRYRKIIFGVLACRDCRAVMIKYGSSTSIKFGHFKLCVFILMFVLIEITWFALPKTGLTVCLM